MDKIKITNLKVFAYHGVFPEETRDGQDFYVNAELYCDCRRAGIRDLLEESIDYGFVSHLITEFLQKHTYRLIEAAAERLSEELLLTVPFLEKVKIELCKPHAPIGLPFENVSVTLEREWHTAYLSVGSNMGEKEAYIKNGIAQMKQDRRIRIVKESSLLVTSPYGGVEQEDFINGAVKIKTLLTPRELLDALHRIEQNAGRERKVHWGPRTLDLDIIFYDKLVYEDDDLIIPHVDMQNRGFVLKPMMELCPNYRHPLLRKTVAELYEKQSGIHHVVFVPPGGGMRGKVKAVIFDLDGTIINSEEGVTKCVRHALKCFGIEETDLKKLTCFIGPPLAPMFQEKYGFTNEEALKAVEKYRERFDVKGIYECTLYDGILECVRQLKEMGYLVALASSKLEIACERILDYFSLTEYFDFIVGSTPDGSISTKQEVLEELGRRMADGNIAKDEMCLVGDTKYDAAGARQFGIACIGVSYGFGTKEELIEAGAVRVCDTAAEVLSCFLPEA